MEKRKDTPKQQVPTWNYIQHPVINDNGKEYEQVCLHACVSVCVCKLNHFAIHQKPTQHYKSIQFSSVQSRTTLGDPMNCSAPGPPVHHQLPESTQIHVH